MRNINTGNAIIVMFGIDETRIQYAMSQNLLKRGHKIVVPNISWSYLYWEADLLSVTKANYLNEFEIKVSKQDFEKDFLKRKHIWLKRCDEHRYMKMPNYFWYVAPINSIPICIPDYAGLIEITEQKHRLEITDIKKPKQLHKKKITEQGISVLLRSTMFKYWDLAHALDTNKIQREIFKN